MLRKLMIALMAATLGGVLGTIAAPLVGPHVIPRIEPYVRPAASYLKELLPMARMAEQRPPAVAPAAEQPIEIAESETFTVKPVTLRVTLPVSGTLNPRARTAVKAQVAAQVGEVLVEEGQEVGKGEVLVRIDISDLESTLNERLANLEGAKAQHTLARKSRDAKVKLAEKGYAARLTVNEVESVYEASAANVRALEAQVDAARRALEKAEVKAPMAGIVATRAVDPGDKVSVDTPLLTIVSLDEMEIDAPVPASEIGLVKIGQPVAFQVPGLAERRFEGIVARINPVARAGTRSIPVYISLDNPGGLLRGGMFAEGEIVIEEAADVLAVPDEAIRDENGETYVLKLEEGRIRRQPVTAEAQRSGGLVRVSGLAAGDRIIAATGIELPPETPVRVSRL